MVAYCEKLFENQSVRGTLHIVVDNSKFLIKFYESLSVGISLDKESVSGNLNEYIDLTHVPSSKGVVKTSQKVVKAVGGQFISLIPLDQVIPLKESNETKENENTQYSCRDCVIIPNYKRKNGRVNKNQQVVNSESGFVENECHEIVEGNNNDRNQYFCGVEPVKSEGEVLFEEEFEEKALINPHTDILFPKEESIENGKVSEVRNANQVHYCKNCCRYFKSSQDLKDHKKVKIDTEYSCDECCEVFPFRAFLEVHKKSNHGTPGASVVFKDNRYWYSCDMCGKLVKNLVKLQLHNLKHTGEGYFQCCLCPEKFGERVDLSQHLKTHCQRASGMIRCRWCNKWFSNKGALAKHKLNCKEIRCHLCDSVFPNKTSRNQHYKDFHPNDILRCQFCSLLFSSQADLNSHTLSHSKAKKKQCTLCGLFFSRLSRHMLKHRKISEFAEDEIFYCDKCPAKYTNQSTFYRHWKSHSGEKPYQCPNCPRTFTNCGALRKHLRRHGSLLPNVCEVCGQDCQSIEQLKTHMLTHSEDYSLFPCSVCTQSFMYRNSLETHMQTKHPDAFAASLSTAVVENESFEAVQEISAVEAVQEIGTATAFANNPTGLLEVVIPGLPGLVNPQNATPHFEIVIVEKS